MELEKLKVAEASHKAFKNLDTRIGEYIKNLDMQFGNINANANADSSVGVGTLYLNLRKTLALEGWLD